MATAIGGHLLGWRGYGPFGAPCMRLTPWPRTNATWHGPNELCTQLGRAFFADLFSVFGFHRRFPIDLLADPATESVLLMVNETLLCFVFLFFLGLGLRTRFRLR